MMGKQGKKQGKLFYAHINIEKRVPRDHILRKVDGVIDFDFVYQEVADTYGANGNVSVPPPVILKMLFLLIFYNVRSERELMETIPLRLDWLWFLGYDLDDEIPHHSVLSKAKRRWGSGVFQTFFERIVGHCVDAGLVSGDKLFVDSSLVDADASNKSVIDRQSLARHLKKGWRILESRLDKEGGSSDDDDDTDIPKGGVANRRYVSTTDPDASVVRRGKGGPKLRYQTHRGVDARHEVITATEVTPGEANEAHRMGALIEGHHRNTGRDVRVVVADNKYGTVENYLWCAERGIRAHIRSLEETHRGSGRQEGIFPKEAFTYDAVTDTFTCPAGQTLRKRSWYKERNHFEYAPVRGVCGGCHLREQCTRSEMRRTVKRHIRQDELDKMREQSESRRAKEDLMIRRHLMERTFARAVRYGFDRARWRRLWRVEIQEYLTAAIQNIQILVQFGGDMTGGQVSTVITLFDRGKKGLIQACFSVYLFFMTIVSQKKRIYSFYPTIV